MEDLLTASPINRKLRGAGPTGMAGEIASILERRMTIGQYKASEMLSFSKLAEEFKVSRQPVSIAISHLRTLGYVEVVPQVGCRIVSPALSELTDFFAMLGRIEGFVAAMAAERHQGREAEDLLALRPMVDLEEIGEIEVRLRYVDYLDRYHGQIWKMARAPLLFNQLGGLRRLSSFYLWQGQANLTPEAALKLTAERRQIARLIGSRKADAASDMMERHIRHKPVNAGLYHGNDAAEANQATGKKVDSRER